MTTKLDGEDVGVRRSTVKLGPCCRIIGEDESTDEVIICGDPGFDEVLVRNPFGLYIVTLCVKCKGEHFEFYENRARERAIAFEERQRRREEKQRMAALARPVSSKDFKAVPSKAHLAPCANPQSPNLGSEASVNHVIAFVNVFDGGGVGR